jgi:phenylpyruvate tautomerase PptA (4-oxalocrotonate tautomerase family)
MIQALIGPVTGLLDKFIEDKDQKNALAHEISTMAEKHAHEAAMQQILVNKEEAKHKSIFVAGWRPFIGWTCGVALAYHFVLAPLIIFGIAWYGSPVPEIPTFDMDSLMTVLLGMLGLGGLRTYEKQKGLTK